MLIRILFILLAIQASFAAAQEATTIAEIKHEGPVDFEKEVLPIFRKNCLACHNGSKHENDLILETPESIAKGGAAGASVVPGKALESYLLKLAAYQEEPVMPPAGNTAGAKKLTSEELGLLKLWIDQGAKGSVSGPKPIAWQPLPEKFRPIYATAITPDGRYAAAARANQITIHHLPSKRDLGRLTDPALLATGVYKNPGVAHLDFVESLAFSPTGDRLASGSFRTIHLWKKSLPQPSGALEELPAMVAASSISRDGAVIAIGDASGAISLYAAAGGKPLRKIVSPGGAILSLDFSADGKELLALQAEKVAHIYKIEDGSALAHLPVAEGAKAGVLASGGARVALGFEDGKLRIYDRASLPADAAAAPESIAVQKEIALPAGAFVSFTALAGDDVASGGQDGQLRITNVVSGETPTTLGHGAAISSIAIHPAGSHYVTLGGGMSKLWRASDKQLVGELKGDFRLQYATASSERQVAKADQAINNSKADLAEAEKTKKEEEENLKKATEAKGKAEMELAQKKEAAKKPIEEKTAADASAAQLAATQTEAAKAKEAADQAVTKAEADLTAANAAAVAAEKAKVDAQAALQKAQEAKAAAEAALTKAAAEAKQAADKAKQLEAPAQKAKDDLTAAERGFESATRGLERGQESLDRATKAVPAAQQVVGQMEEARKARGAELEEQKKQAASQEKPLQRAVFTRDGQQVVAATETGDLFTWDVSSGAAVEAISTGVASPGLLLATTEDRIALAGAESKSTLQGTTVAWTLERTIGAVEQPSILVDRVLSLDFSPDGKFLASGGGEPSRSGELKIWNVETGELVKAIPEAHSDTINSVAFSPDGSRLATCGSDRFAKVFDVAEGKLIRPLEGHTHYVLGVTWRADGRTIATSAADMVIKIWDARTGDQLRTIQGYTKEVNSVRFVGLSDEVITTSGDNAVRIKNASNGGGIRDLGGASDFMFSLGVSADGKTIIAGGQDGVLRVWNDQGQSLATFAP